MLTDWQHRTTTFLHDINTKAMWNFVVHGNEAVLWPCTSVSLRDAERARRFIKKAGSMKWKLLSLERLPNADRLKTSHYDLFGWHYMKTMWNFVVQDKEAFLRPCTSVSTGNLQNLHNDLSKKKTQWCEHFFISWHRWHMLQTGCCYLPSGTSLKFTASSAKGRYLRSQCWSQAFKQHSYMNTIVARSKKNNLMWTSKSSSIHIPPTHDAMQSVVPTVDKMRVS